MTVTECPRHWISCTTPELMAGVSEVVANGLGALMGDFVDTATTEIRRRLDLAQGLHLVDMTASEGGLLAWCQHPGCSAAVQVDLEWSDGAHKSACWVHAAQVGAARWRKVDR